MASITLSIPDELKDRVLNGFCGQFNYQETISQTDEKGEMTTTPNSETKLNFMKRMLMKGIKNAVKSYEIQQATKTVREDKKTELDNLELVQ